MTNSQKNIKRTFDIVFSLIGLIILGPIICFFILFSKIYFKESGVFKQNRIGYNAKEFIIFKIKSINSKSNKTSNYGNFIRKYKIDELPQLYNVLKGEMSLVGPRPDLPGFADLLIGEDIIILTVKPGITGPASIFFKNEEQLLKTKSNPELYNLKIIWPKKVEINKTFIKEYSFFKDLYYILKTLF